MSAVKSFSLDAFQLKIIALIIMTIDHIHYFLGLVTPLPFLLTLIGRIAAPIFVFMVANGFAHTKSRGKYLLRLYVAATLMQLGNLVINTVFPLPENAIVMNGIFSTMTLIVFFLLCIETLRNGIHLRRISKIVLGILGIVLPFALGALTFALIPVSVTAARVLMIFVPTPFLAEGGPLFILMGLGFYYCRHHKIAISVFYGILIAILVALSGISALNLAAAFFMLLALPFILLYNGEKGRSMKYLFYAYYPAHVYLLAIVASILGR